MSDGCNCVIAYDVVECHIRALNTDGSEDSGAVWLTSDSIVNFDLTPELETGAKKVIKCKGRIKYTLEQPDTLIGATVKVSFCCQNAEIEYIIGGSCGTMVFDSSSPPCAIGYVEPTHVGYLSAVPFEMKLYLKQILGSSTVGYKELHFYYCNPTFISEKGDQEDYLTPDYTIFCLDNRNY